MADRAIFSIILESFRAGMQELQFVHGVENQVKKLEEQLRQMLWFLRNTASANQETVLDWVIPARSLAYEAENLIESHAIKVASRRQGGTRGTIKRIAGVLNECYHRHQIGSDIETLLSKISVLTKGFDRYGVRLIIEKRDDGASRQKLLRRAYSTLNDENELFVGSQDVIDMLAEKLVSDQYRTVTLHGMGGLGKTTLARKVYQHPVVMKHFDGFSWVSVSQQWQKDDILRGIVIKLLPEQRRPEIQIWRDEELVRELSQFLSTRKCLLVLDDIWSIDAWNSIKSAIHINQRGSKVLLTTRNVEVATLVDTNGYKHKPQFLTEDDSWKLLCHKALRDQDSEETTKKEKIGKKMIAQCGGLPLAVVALGGILSLKSSYDEWISVGDNIKSYLRKVKQGEENVEAILALSYDDLPFQLKPCFLYLSKYAEDVEIGVETLYQYWMAEGMVSGDDRMADDETIMDVAEHYLNELAERCMVFVQKEEEEPYRRFKSCRLHDLMRDLCISKAEEEKFLTSTDYGNTNDVAKASSSTICRLSISFRGENEVKRFVPPAKAVRRCLRSFTLDFNDGYSTNTSKLKFTEFEMLRVLSIAGISPSKKGNINDFESFVDVCGALVYHTKIPLSLGKLVHLRYMRLTKWSSPFFITSASISNLKQLQTLDLRGSKLMLMPNVIWKLPRLTHLYLPNSFHIQPCCFAKKLGLDGLPELEILEGFNNKVCNVNHLSTLTNLRKLEATVEDKVEDLEEVINQVRKLTYLRFLELEVSISDLSSSKAVAIMNDVLSCSNLVNLHIWGKLSKFPEYDSFLCRNLRSLKLEYCQIEEDPLSTLERLPNLRSLYLETNCFVGKELSCHASGFPQLRTLLLRNLQNLEKWEIEDGAMPYLSQLTIMGCRKLEMIPAGLRSNTLLKKLNISGIPKELRSNTLLKNLNISGMPEEFKDRVRVNEDGVEGPDFHKVRHIQTIYID